MLHPVTAQDRQYEREEDARTLKRATEVKMNPKKLKAAFSQLKHDQAVADKAVIDVKKLFKSK